MAEGYSPLPNNLAFEFMLTNCSEYITNSKASLRGPTAPQEAWILQLDVLQTSETVNVSGPLLAEAHLQGDSVGRAPHEDRLAAPW